MAAFAISVVFVRRNGGGYRAWDIAQRMPPTRMRPVGRTTVDSTGGKEGSHSGVRAQDGSISTAVAASAA